jgi:hypothetical protein
MIPNTTRESMLEAMERFDRELRDSPEWANWEQKESHKYAIEQNSHRYPVKKIVSIATDTPVASFSGGDGANSYVEKLGFSIVPLRQATQAETSIQALLQQILSGYLAARSGDGFGKNHPIWQAFVRFKNAIETLPSLRDRRTLRVDWSVGKGNWAGVPWLAIIDSTEAEAPRRGVYCVFLFREDMTGVYTTLNQGVTKPKQEMGTAGARRYLKENATQIRAKLSFLQPRDFHLDEGIDLRSEGLGADYEDSTIAYKLYETGRVPSDADVIADLEALLVGYARVLDSAQKSEPESLMARNSNEAESQSEFDRPSAIQELVQAVEAAGFIFEPWQIAAYVTALRTKPFVILAGVTGTGKSKLPTLVARLTGGQSELIPVRPDWTDSADVVGYVDLQGIFRPGRLLQNARNAAEQSSQHWTCIVDEMNLARVEQYFAEVLSRVEDRHPAPSGGFASRPLVTTQLRREDQEWGEIGLPANLAIVGTVNMDESTHGFSRKVLDRAFTIELSDTDLTRWNTATSLPTIAQWPAEAWYPRATSLAGLSGLNPEDTETVTKVIDVLTTINGFLQQAQLQVGYRTRDEVALFGLHASELANAFLTREGAAVNPLDLAIHMKILPRLVGGSGAVRRAVLQLLGWARSGKPFVSDDDAQAVRDEWIDLGRPGALSGSIYPRTAGRLCIMWERFLSEGYTSYWL